MKSRLAKIVAQHLKTWRTMRDLTAREVGDMIGTNASGVINVETGKVAPSLRFIEALCKAMCISPIQMFSEGPDKCRTLFNLSTSLAYHTARVDQIAQVLLQRVHRTRKESSHDRLPE